MVRPLTVSGPSLKRRLGPVPLARPMAAAWLQPRSPMLRLLLRLCGFLCLAVAFAAMIVDGTRSIAAGAPAIMPLGSTASALFPDLLVKLHAATEAHLPPLWDPVLVTLLLMPAWLVLGVLGILLVAAARRPRDKIGYARR